MKRIFTLSAVTLIAAAGAASAMVAPSTVDINEIRSYAPNADVSLLSASEITSLVNRLHSIDSQSEKTQAVRSVFNAK